MPWFELAPPEKMVKYILRDKLLFELLLIVQFSISSKQSDLLKESLNNTINNFFPHYLSTGIRMRILGV